MTEFNNTDIEQFVMVELWGCDATQKPFDLSEPQRAVLVDIINTVRHFAAPKQEAEPKLFTAEQLQRVRCAVIGELSWLQDGESINAADNIAEELAFAQAASHPKEEEAKPSDVPLYGDSQYPRHRTMRNIWNLAIIGDRAGFVGECEDLLEKFTAQSNEPHTYREALIETVRTIESWEDTAIGHLMKGEQTLPAQTFQKWFAIHIRKIHAALSSSISAPTEPNTNKYIQQLIKQFGFTGYDARIFSDGIMNGISYERSRRKATSAPTGELVEALPTKQVAAIIKHPYRDFDYRVDLFTVPANFDDYADIRRHCEMKMLGPFEVIAISDKVAARALASYNQSTNPDKK